MKSTAGRLSIGVALIIAIGFVQPVFADYAAGMAAFKAKDYAKAAEEFKAVIASQPNEPATHYMLGLSQRAQGSLSPAVAELRKAVELDSASAAPNPLYTITLGQTLNQTKQYGEAYSTLKAVDFSEAPGKLSDHIRPALCPGSHRVQSRRRSGQRPQCPGQNRFVECRPLSGPRRGPGWARRRQGRLCRIQASV